MKNKKMAYISGALLASIVALGIFASGCTSSSTKQAPANDKAAEKTTTPVAELSSGEVQNITSKLTANGYPQITVMKGIPVKWNLQADAKDLNGCNNRLIIPAYNIEKKLKAGDNIIEFTPTEDGTIAYSCWMGMITSKINVVEEAAEGSQDSSTVVPAVSPHVESEEESAPAGGCCGI